MRKVKSVLCDLGCLLIVYLACAAIAVAVFHNDMLSAARAITGLFWLYVLPGFLLLELFTRLNFIESLALGGVIGFTLTTMAAYYLNVLAYVPLSYMPLVALGIIGLGALGRLWLDRNCRAG
jgi:uncharacterized membrane protein